MTTVPENIKETDVTNVLSSSFLDYSMSVIVSRAIPDVRDGLKPVHRRILYAMFDLKMTPDKPYKKSARIVGEVIGKYHPHGDTAVYDSMVRMAQPFSMSVPLVDGHGNFGSMDGDSPAAMRYTESRLQKVSMPLLEDLDFDTVDYADNYDGTEREPKVLPSRFPNLLVNGTEGIAVGMATKMPPHNLREVCNGVVAQIENPNITTEELMEHIKGPDFPTGAMIMGEEGIVNAYETGRGSVTVRSVIEVEEKNGKIRLIVTQIPYQVNKERLLESIRQIQRDWDGYQKERNKKGNKVKVKEKGFDFLANDGVTDETDCENENNSVRIVLELKRGVNPELALKYLYKHTQLQTSFSTLALSLVPKQLKDGSEKLEPKVLTLKQMIDEYIKHQKVVEVRKQKFILKEKEKEAYKKVAIIAALDQVDESIKIIRSSKTKSEAQEGLMALLSVEKEQANHILDMRIQALANFEQDKLRKDYEKLLKEMEKIKAILASEKEIFKIIKKSLKEIAENFGRDRLTEIKPPAEDINLEDLIEDDEVVVTITHNGFIKRTLESAYRTQRRNGRGVNGMTTYEDDFVKHLQIARNHDTMLFFTNLGRVYRLKVYEIQEANTRARGVIIRSLLNLENDETVQAILSVREFSDQQNLFFVTQKGIAKKTTLSNYANVRRNGIAAITLDEGDRLVDVSLTSGDRNVTLVTKRGLSITFNEASIKSVGRTGRGVKGIDLAKDDQVISFIIHEEDADLFIATNNGYGKRTSLSEYRVQNRGGKGILSVKLTDKNGEVIGTQVVQEQDTLMLVTKNGTLMKLLVDEISQFSRNTQGTRVINLRDGDELQAVARIVEAEPSEEEFEAEEE